MNWKRNPALVMGLCVALGVAVLVIFMMTMNNSKQPQKLVPVPVPYPSPPPPPRTHETVVGSDKPALVLFYADWCGHSKNMLPAWQQVSQMLKSSGKVEAIQFEQESHALEIQKNNIQGFPAIRYYPDGFPSENYVEYHGNRSVDSLMKFAQSGGKDA